MISVSDVFKRDIQFHYDLATVFYRLLWGRHIHHGLWDGNESPRAAQLNLTNTLARLAHLAPGESVLDVGSGMGGSAIHLVRTHGVNVTGITLSPFQQLWSSLAATCVGLSPRVRFQKMDAEQAEFPAERFDVVWSIECTEHLFDKPGFFHRAAGWLRPGGRMAICAWLAGKRADDPVAEALVRRVCQGFLCPSLGSFDDYSHWLQDAGLEVEQICDWTDRVLETWEICRRRVQRTGVRWLARIIDRQTTQFLDDFTTILDAYRSRAMGYGCFVARKTRS